MNNDQQSLLAAALQRAAATMRGGMQPPNFDMTGMLNPASIAGQRQPGMQPTPNAQVDSRFGGMQPSGPASFADRFGSMDPATLAKGDMLQANPNQRVAQNFPPMMAAGGVPMPQPRPQMASAAVGPTSVGGAPLQGATPQPPQPMGPMGFFQRNSAMMRDPATGAFIDPQAAAQAQGGGIIPKMLGLLNNRANNAAVGPTSVGGAPLQNAQRPNGGLLSQMMWHMNGNGNG